VCGDSCLVTLAAQAAELRGFQRRSILESSHSWEASVPVSQALQTPGVRSWRANYFNSLLRSSYTARDGIGINDAIIAHPIGARNLT
jgi:hypothetical protein